MTKIELLLIRGLPGSGKTTLAKKYAEAGYVHCEADGKGAEDAKRQISALFDQGVLTHTPKRV